MLEIGAHNTAVPESTSYNPIVLGVDSPYSFTSSSFLPLFSPTEG